MLSLQLELSVPFPPQKSRPCIRANVESLEPIVGTEAASDAIEPLDVNIDDRVARAARIASRVFGDDSKAASWLSKRNGVFDGQAPLIVAQESAMGCARVCRFLNELATV